MYYIWKEKLRKLVNQKDEDNKIMMKMIEEKRNQLKNGKINLEKSKKNYLKDRIFSSSRKYMDIFMRAKSAKIKRKFNPKEKKFHCEFFDPTKFKLQRQEVQNYENFYLKNASTKFTKDLINKQIEHNRLQKVLKGLEIEENYLGQFQDV